VIQKQDQHSTNFRTLMSCDRFSQGREMRKKRGQREKRRGGKKGKGSRYLLGIKKISNHQPLGDPRSVATPKGKKN